MHCKYRTLCIANISRHKLLHSGADAERRSEAYLLAQLPFPVSRHSQICMADKLHCSRIKRSRHLNVRVHEYSGAIANAQLRGVYIFEHR